MRGTINKIQLKSGRISWGFVCDCGRNEKGKRRQVTRQGFERKKEAEDALRQAIADAEKGCAVTKDPRTFGSFFTEWLRTHGDKKWGKMTIEANTRRGAYAVRMFGDVPLQKLTSTRIEQDLDTLLARGGRKTAKHPDGQPLSRKTVREIAALISQALGKAVKRNWLSKNPMDNVERPSAEIKEVQIPEPGEYERFLDCVQGTRYYALSVFAAASGCRRGELLALKWSDVDLKSGIIAVSKSLSVTKAGLEIKGTKSGRTRHVRVSRITIQVLLEHKKQIEREKELFAEDYKPNNLVFPTPDGDYYKPDQVTGRISEFMRKAGVDASLHTLRHLHASLMLSQHVPITVISKRLGHANSYITQTIYSHAMKDDEATASVLWDEATSAIIERTQIIRKEPSPQADVMFCEVVPIAAVVNE